MTSSENGQLSGRGPDEVERAEAITAYAALACGDCGCISAHHSDIGNCEACDCESFEED